VAVLKILRRISAGRHPQTEMTGYLTERGFANVPALLGELVRIDKDGNPNTLLIAERFVRNQGDAWQWTLEALKRAIDPVAITGAEDQTKEDVLAPALSLAAAIGKRLAELHAVLAEPTDDPAFQPEIIGPTESGALAAAAIAELAAACRALAAFTGWKDQEQSAKADWLIERRGQLDAKLHRLARSAPGTLRTRIHGDFHLGQVLVTPGDAMLIDFEGEPSKSVAERRGKYSPLRDVAGLLRSFAYAAAILEREPAPASEPSAERRADLLRRFVADASASFLDGYRGPARAARHPWYSDDAAAAALIDLFLLQKAAYEVNYEAANRPSWIGVPLAGLASIAERLLARDEETAYAG